MALVVNGIERSFTFKKGNETITLSDPNLSDTPDAVMSYYANLYPELTTASVHGPEIREDRVVYEFKTTIGTKG
ncbi:MAG: PRTRC system protein C [Tannerella sp.]|jgi:PRTRC genetic system protein C|nr:PRTRC system protein C [Tannerella sp.]